MVTNTLARGGMEAMAVRLAQSVDRTQIEPVLICLQEAGPWADSPVLQSIPMHSGLLRHKYDFGALGRLCGLIERYAPACVMAVGNGGDRMFWSAWAARRMNASFVVWSHMCPTRGHRTFEWINRWFYGRVDAFVALGQRHREALIDLESVPADRVSIVRNGIDATAFDQPHQRGVARSLLGASGDEVVIGIIANLRADKRHDLFVSAASKVRTARPNVRFVIIGDGPLREQVRSHVVAADPHSAYIRMLGARDDVATLLQGLDIVCLTSQWQECLSVAMLEAMAAGKAFVAPRIGSLDEALIDGATGRFFDPFTSDALAGVLIELIDRPDVRASLGRQAREKVRTEFTIDQMARHFEALVTRLT